MKKQIAWQIYTALLACCIHTLYAEPWHSQFAHYDFAPILKALGYDPKISLYAADKNTVEEENAVTVYAHAWADSQESINYFRRNSFMLPGTIIGFNFKDAHRGGSLPPYWLSNFCQTGDIASLLLTLKVIVECGIEKIHLFGHSRGGGTILTTLARLYQYEKYKTFFTEIGITAEMAQKILQKISVGSIVLNCPLVNAHTLIKEKLSWVNLGFASRFISRYILRFFIAYRDYNDCPLYATQELKKKNFNIPTIIHFQKDDVIIGTRTDTELYKSLQGENTYLTIGNEGGHMHSGKQFGIILQAFYKKYGAAYYNDDALIKQSNNVLLQAQPSPENLPAIAKDLYSFNQTGLISFVDNPKIPWLKKLTEYNLVNIQTNIGYNPQIRVYDTDALTTDTNPHAQASTTVYVHGLGENAQTIIPYFKLNTFLLPGTVVGFDFPDVIPGTFASKYSKLNLAQTEDIAVLTSILKILDECGLKVIHLFGTSRGGGTIINTLGRLCTYEKYKNFFETLGVSEKQASDIINKIRTGTIILNVPLVDSHAVARYWFKFLGSTVMNSIIPRITAHNPRGDQALDAAKIIKEKKFNTLVHFEHKDERVGNVRDAEFYKNVMGPNTYLVLADDGGHLHSGKTLEKAVQAFRKKYNGPFYNIEKLISEGDAILQQSQPLLSAVEQYVRDAYINFEKIRKLKTLKPSESAASHLKEFNVSSQQYKITGSSKVMPDKK